MAGLQQDYLLRQIEMIGRFIARLRQKGKLLTDEDRAELDETIIQVMHLQEKNFGMPAAKFLALTTDGQIAALRRDESRKTGQARCLTYADILKTTAELYEYRGRDDLALGARQLALDVALSVTQEQPNDLPAAQTLVDELRAVLAPPR